MSYDVSIGDKSFNYTYNVSTLFYDHIPAVSSTGGLSEIDGKTGRQACAILQKAFCEINNRRISMGEDDVVGEPNFCAAYDAFNGWGSAVGGLIFLAEILAACAEFQRKKVRVS